MRGKIACCGYCCERCPAYRENVTGPAYQQAVSDGWFAYYGFRMPPESICCDGCIPEDCDTPHRIDQDCAVRACVLDRGLSNCAHCDQYACEELKEKIVDPDEVVERAGGSIPPEDYDRFVRPYASKQVLEEIRRDAAPGLDGG